MKKVYVAKVTWYEDEKWMQTNLHVYSNRKAAQSYVDWKNNHKSEKSIADKSLYELEEFPLWSKNLLAE